MSNNAEPLDKIIKTTSIVHFSRMMNILANFHAKTIFAITGRAGMGKTRAVNHLVSNQSVQRHTGLPQTLQVVVPPKPTAKSLTSVILEAINIKPVGANAREYARQVVAVLLRQDIGLLILDEGDRLNTESFEILRDIHDNPQSAFQMAIVGLPKLMVLIRRYEQFDSRVSLEIPFRAMKTADILAEFLPNVDLPHWTFNADNPDDREMGEYLWERTKPSLRRLTNVLALGDAIAGIDDDPLVTLNHCKEAFTMMRTRSRPETDADENTVVGTMELLSALRHQAKHK